MPQSSGTNLLKRVPHTAEVITVSSRISSTLCLYKDKKNRKAEPGAWISYLEMNLKIAILSSNTKHKI
jgi:hypothetical protein